MSNSNMDVTMDEIMSYEPAYPEIYYKNLNFALVKVPMHLENSIL